MTADQCNTSAVISATYHDRWITRSHNGVYLVHKHNPVKRILIYFWGTHYKVKYHDCTDKEHTIHMFVRDPREALLIHRVFQEFANQSQTKKAQQ